MENKKNSSANPLFNVQLNEVLPGRSSCYNMEAFLGQGTFGKVARARNLSTNELVALKVVRNDYIESGRKEAEALEKVRRLDPDRNNLLKFDEHFMYKNHFCLVLEMLDMSLFDLMSKRKFSPLHICEIRAIAQQMLVSLKALKSINLVHADIKPDNIMLVDHDSQPFKVKLIDFGLATEAPNLWKKGIIQNLAYRAPEVLLHHPTLDEAVDMWTLGCVLAFLFLGNHLFPMDSEYEAIRMMMQLNGKPGNEFLDAAFNTDCFFNLVQESPRRVWWLKSPQQYSQETGVEVKRHRGVSSHFYSLDHLLAMQPGRMNPADCEDTRAFIDLLKQMLTVDPSKRITPSEALKHDFITMNHLPLANNGPYVISAKTLMMVCKSDEEKWISKREEDNTRTSGGSNHKQAAAAGLSRKASNDVTDRVRGKDQRKEENIRAPGMSGKQAAGNKTSESRVRKKKLKSAPKTVKEQRATSKTPTSKNETHESSLRKEKVTSIPENMTKDQRGTSEKCAFIKRKCKVRTIKGETPGLRSVTKGENNSSEVLLVKNETFNSCKEDVRTSIRAVKKDQQHNKVAFTNRAYQDVSREEERSSKLRLVTEDQQWEPANQLTGKSTVGKVKGFRKRFKSIQNFSHGPFKRHPAGETTINEEFQLFEHQLPRR